MRRLWLSGTTRRYHTVPGLSQDVAAHSWGVAMLLLRLHPNPSMELIKAALYHDCAEKFVGDVPSPTKWKSETLLKELERMEQEVALEMGLHVELSDGDRCWLNAVDTLELVLYCDHEWKKGNEYAREVRDRGIFHLRERTTTPPAILNTLNLWENGQWDI